VALLGRYIEQKHTVGEALDGTVPDDLIGICEVSRVCRAFPAPDTTTQSSHPLSTGPEQTRPLCGTQQTLLRTLATLSPGDLPQDGKRLPRSRLDGETNRRIRGGFAEGRVARDQLRQRSGRVSLRFSRAARALSRLTHSPKESSRKPSILPRLFFAISIRCSTCSSGSPRASVASTSTWTRSPSRQGSPNRRLQPFRASQVRLVALLFILRPLTMNANRCHSRAGRR
jgi:hypothetical protein